MEFEQQIKKLAEIAKRRRSAYFYGQQSDTGDECGHMGGNYWYINTHKNLMMCDAVPLRRTNGTDQDWADILEDHRIRQEILQEPGWERLDESRDYGDIGNFDVI